MPFRLPKVALLLVLGLSMVVSAPAMAAARNAKSQAKDPQVILLRGLANVFSLGMDDLSKQLHEAGVESKVYNHAQWHELVRQIKAAYQANPNGTRPIVLIGHSLGANAVLLMGKELAESGIPVDLVVTFDPTRSGPVTPAVRRYLNLYQSNNGWGEALDGAPNSKRIVNSDIRKRKDVGSNVGHTNIDKNQVLHQQVVDDVVKLVKGSAGRS